MKIAGIIAEYNPYHNGHRYLAESVRRAGATHIVAVMGGNFLQRGEPAMAPKQVRAAAALEGGVDLVLELPLPYGCAAAGQFAFGGISILRALGAVDMLAFGSESGDMELLTAAAEAISSPELSAAMEPFLKSGMSFASARERAVRIMAGTRVSDQLMSPNNILAVEYLLQLSRLGGGIEPFTVAREGVGHDSPSVSRSFASATMLRTMLRGGDYSAAMNYMPTGSLQHIKRAFDKSMCADPELMELPVMAKLRTMTAVELEQLPDVNEGLENRLAAAIRTGGSIEEIITGTKSKRYARTRLQRIITCAYLGITEGLSKQQPPYIRILGFTRKGLEILAAAKDTVELPTGVSLAELEKTGELAGRFAAIEARAADLYNLAAPTPQPCGTEYTNQVIKA